MKTPLAYQKTEYDCGPTTVINALSCLFDREDLPPELVKFVMLYLLDTYNDKGEVGKRGTTQMAMMFLSDWMNRFGHSSKFPIHCEYITGTEVFIGENSRIVDGLQRGGVAVVRVMFDCWHYVLLTGCDAKYVYLFDPYYRRKPFKFSGIEMIWDKPTRYNRRVEKEMLNGEGKTPYAFSDPTVREAMLVFNMDKIKAAGADGTGKK